MKAHSKKMILALTVTISLLGLNACGPQSKRISVNDILQGEHQLRKMGQLIGSEEKNKQSLFLVVYNQSESKKTAIFIKFAWKMNDSTYALSSLPIEKVRIKLVKNITAPTVKFKWHNCYLDTDDANLIQKIIDRYSYYALITVNETDWPTDISLPMNH